MHINLELLFSAGILPINTVGEPGAHGATVLGTQAAGVNTPNFAAVAAATTGLAIELHIPNGKILTMGLLSIMVAAGLLDVKTLLFGITIRLDGATPKLHCIIAPVHTHMPIEDSFLIINY
jgi:hypothetical protein